MTTLLYQNFSLHISERWTNEKKSKQKDLLETNKKYIPPSFEDYKIYKMKKMENHTSKMNSIKKKLYGQWFIYTWMISGRK